MTAVDYRTDAAADDALVDGVNNETRPDASELPANRPLPQVNSPSPRKPIGRSDFDSRHLHNPWQVRDSWRLRPHLHGWMLCRQLEGADRLALITGTVRSPDGPVP